MFSDSLEKKFILRTIYVRREGEKERENGQLLGSTWYDRWQG